MFGLSLESKFQSLVVSVEEREFVIGKEERRFWEDMLLRVSVSVLEVPFWFVLNVYTGEDCEIDTMGAKSFESFSKVDETLRACSRGPAELRFWDRCTRLRESEGSNGGCLVGLVGGEDIDPTDWLWLCELRSDDASSGGRDGRDLSLKDPVFRLRCSAVFSYDCERDTEGDEEEMEEARRRVFEEVFFFLRASSVSWQLMQKMPCEVLAYCRSSIFFLQLRQQKHEEQKAWSPVRIARSSIFFWQTWHR